MPGTSSIHEFLREAHAAYTVLPYRAAFRVWWSPDDLIVTGVHGRNALDLMLFGSTTSHVVRRASCPVLTLKK